MLSPKASLAQRQQQFVQRIFFPTDTATSVDSAQRKGLAIYQNNLLFTASRALQLTYPVLTQLLGQEAIRQLSHTLLQTAPPTTGDWGDWGQALKALIAAEPLAEAYPFLPDVIAFEWALHQAGRSASHAIDRHALSLVCSSLIQRGSVLRATIQLSPAVSILTSDYPVDHIWQAHQTSNGTQTFSATEFATAIERQQGRCLLLIFQRDRHPQWTRLSDAEIQWLSDITNGLTIGELLDRHPQFDFTHWLTGAIEQNWISQLKVIH